MSKTSILIRTLYAAGVVALIGSHPTQNALAQPAPATLYGAAKWSASVQGGWTRQNFSATYSSSGIQLPAVASVDKSGGEVCGGVNVYVPIGIGGLEYGGGINYCDETVGKFIIISLPRHGPNGYVIGQIDPGPRVEFYGGLHIPGVTAPQTPIYVDHFFVRMGLVMSRNEFSFSSDQRGFGGQLEQSNSSLWVNGFGVQAGASFKFCNDCLFGRSGSFFVLGKAVTDSGSKTIAAPSSAFGFTEYMRFDVNSSWGASGGFSFKF